MSSEKDIVLVTGGNTGLGWEIVRALAGTSTAYEIIIGCRTVAKGEEAITTIKQAQPKTTSSFSTLQVDLSSDSSLEQAVEHITSKYGRLDVLINNGGAAFDQDIASGRSSIRDAFNNSWDTNVSGTHVLTTLSVPLLLKSMDPRLLFITSGTSSLAETEMMDNDMHKRLNASPPAGWPKPPIMSHMAYRSSKTGLNMLMREWRRLLLNDGVKVWAISPGFLATGLTGAGAEKLKQMGALEPSVGGEFVRDVVQGKRDEYMGKVIRRNEIQPW
ncbi:hypothetical protein PFICI_15191 [Pestalotiopsis fici W106-1]|uniref:NAD(P)-binding protein n=1 Tax=Pestalotiopsis fici (strain W106-1 / CGMCC3.15140) TaxID=1229662 RepID=W3WJN3_PESFW|nr:uncharacterized protein PFICI_15191 [Pestalotiopsis fici W106-1]ETS73016.1 hypothetical protein PFICI_15191 [Pestalotiopsis fici W106-1]